MHGYSRTHFELNVKFINKNINVYINVIFLCKFQYNAPHFYSSNNNFPQILFRFQFYILSGNSVKLNITLFNVSDIRVPINFLQ